jgi:sugar lactone lactonase YvrE
MLALVAFVAALGSAAAQGGSVTIQPSGTLMITDGSTLNVVGSDGGEATADLHTKIASWPIAERALRAAGVLPSPTLQGETHVFAGDGIAGATNGPALDSVLSSPMKCDFGWDGTMFVIEQHAPGGTYPDATGSVRTVRDGMVGRLTPPTLKGPGGLALSPSGLVLYVSERPAHVITRIDATTGESTVLVGQRDQHGWKDGAVNDGDIMFHDPCGLAISQDGTTLYVTDIWNHAIRTVDTKTGFTSTLCGYNRTTNALLGLGGEDGPFGVGRLNTPVDAALSPTNPALLFVVDYGTQCDGSGVASCARVRMVDVSTGYLSTLAGSGSQGYVDAIGTSASFAKIHSLALSMDGATLYVGDQSDNNDGVPEKKVRAVDLRSRAVSTVLNDAVALTGVNGMCLSAHHDGALFVASSGQNQVIKIT